MNRTKRIKNQKKLPEQFPAKPFIQHLDELRTRFFIALIVTFIFSSIGYAFHERLLTLLIKPLGQPIYYTNPGGGFDLVFKISLLFGLLFAMPFVIYQLLAFIKPAIPYISLKKTLLIIVFSWLMMGLGVVVAYFLSLPAALYFLSSFGSPEVKSLISSREYLSFVLLYLFAFGLIFQLPLCLLFINSLKRLKVRQLFSYLRFIILGSFIFAAIITPTPDLFNQLLMALPIILLYLFSGIFIGIINAKKH